MLLLIRKTKTFWTKNRKESCRNKYGKNTEQKRKGGFQHTLNLVCVKFGKEYLYICSNEKKKKRAIVSPNCYKKFD